MSIRPACLPFLFLFRRLPRGLCLLACLKFSRLFNKKRKKTPHALSSLYNFALFEKQRFLQDLRNFERFEMARKKKDKSDKKKKKREKRERERKKAFTYVKAKKRKPREKKRKEKKFHMEQF